MPGPKPRYGTRKAIDELSKELKLQHEEWMQDWPFEVVIPDHIESYIAHYRLTADEDKKFLLMEAIIQATNDQSEQSYFSKVLGHHKTAVDSSFQYTCIFCL